MVPASSPFVTRVVRATRASGSLRATIPQVVASTLDLRAGDCLCWNVDPNTGEVHVERLTGSGGGTIEREEHRAKAPVPASGGRSP